MASHGLCARRQQQGIEFELPAALDLDAAARDVDGAHSRVENEVDPPFGIELRRPQRNPFGRRGSGEKILGKIRAIARRRVIGADDGQRSLIAVAAQSVRGRQSRA